MEDLPVSRDLLQAELDKVTKQDKTGFAMSKSIEDEATQNNLTDEQREGLVSVFDTVQAYEGLYEESETPEADPNLKGRWLELRTQAKQQLEQTVLLGLLNLSWVQERAVFFGAIPDPKDKFKFYRGLEGSYQCWECDTEALLKTVHKSVHFDNLPLAGTGEVKVVPTPYCPNCGPIPSDTGIIKVSEAEQDEAAILGRMRRS